MLARVEVYLFNREEPITFGIDWGEGGTPKPLDLVKKMLMEGHLKTTGGLVVAWNTERVEFVRIKEMRRSETPSEP